jgi:hypothetical protein
MFFIYVVLCVCVCVCVYNFYISVLTAVQDNLFLILTVLTFTPQQSNNISKYLISLFISLPS